MTLFAFCIGAAGAAEALSFWRDALWRDDTREFCRKEVSEGRIIADPGTTFGMEFCSRAAFETMLEDGQELSDYERFEMHDFRLRINLRICIDQLLNDYGYTHQCSELVESVDN